MRKGRLIEAFTIIMATAFTNCDGEYEIIGKTESIPEGQTIFLQKQTDEQFEIVDSATINNGTFFFI